MVESTFSLEYDGQAAKMETHLKYHIQCHLQFGIMQCYNYVLNISSFVSKIKIGCLEIIKL